VYLGTVPAVFRIRIRMDSHSIGLLDPDSAADKISSKSQKNSYDLELFDYFVKAWIRIRIRI
jgi:hypothetical protein